MDDRQFTRIAKALADPRRFALLQRIAADREVACQAIVGESKVTQATISHHVKELINAGLVDVRKEGKCAHFKFCRGVMRDYSRELANRLRG
ncbi:MAG: helix-turn-helix domain-containing protein [Tepidisphaeraceae bacterium]